MQKPSFLCLWDLSHIESVQLLMLPTTALPPPRLQSRGNCIPPGLQRCWHQQGSQWQRGKRWQRRRRSLHPSWSLAQSFLQIWMLKCKREEHHLAGFCTLEKPIFLTSVCLDGNGSLEWEQSEPETVGYSSLSTKAPIILYTHSVLGSLNRALGRPLETKLVCHLWI